MSLLAAMQPLLATIALPAWGGVKPQRQQDLRRNRRPTHPAIGRANPSVEP